MRLSQQNVGKVFFFIAPRIVRRIVWSIGNDADQNKKRHKTMNTSIKLDLGNNESVARGIFKNTDGTFTAMTFSKSKTFKTYAGAVKFLTKLAA